MSEHTIDGLRCVALNEQDGAVSMSFRGDASLAMGPLDDIIGPRLVAVRCDACGEVRFRANVRITIDGTSAILTAKTEEGCAPTLSDLAPYHLAECFVTLSPANQDGDE